VHSTKVTCSLTQLFHPFSIFYHFSISKSFNQFKKKKPDDKLAGNGKK